MRLSRVGSAVAGLTIVASIAVGSVGAQEASFDAEAVRQSVLAHYERLEGPADEQSLELWDDYFLRSPGIGNLHGTNIEIGWEAYHEASARFFARPADRRPAVTFENLEVHIINEHTVWVSGLFVNAYSQRTMRLNFYDSLIRTEEGWGVFFSYVAPPEG